jgi:DNA gyrase/topoisomerase IV subunit A
MFAFINTVEVIEDIRNYDYPKAELIKRFELSEELATSILEISLRQSVLSNRARKGRKSLHDFIKPLTRLPVANL